MAGRRKRARRFTPDGPFEAHIEDLAHDARGISRVDGKVTFITDALPGEDVSYMRTRKKSSFDEGVLETVIKPSPQRVAPKCEHFGLCGGCSLQHLDPLSQIEFKQAQMLDNLQRIGGVQPVEVAEPLKGPLWGYRRRARLGVKHVFAKNRVLVGFRERNTPYIAVLNGCEVLDPAIGKRLLELSGLIAELSIREKLPQIEVAIGDNAIALVLRVLEPPSQDDITRLKEFSTNTSIWFYLQPAGPDSIEPLLTDTPELFFDLENHDIRLYFEPLDFIQVNAELNAAMIDQALDWLNPQSSDSVLELFCGLGNFSMPLARRSKNVVAVEGEASLVQRAQKNAQRNNLGNIQFQVSNLFKTQDGQFWVGQNFDKALIDPPRAGAEEVMPLLAKSGVREILYVSCHPATLARDVALLVMEYGYRLQRAAVMDMFPHTSHVESMALLVKEE